MRFHPAAVAAAAAAALAACSPKPAEQAPTAQATGPAPVASIQELMQSVVMPTADMVWKLPDSIADPASAKATPEQTEADWQTVQRGALQLAEVANLLTMEGRVAAHPGAKLQDEGLEGNLKRDEIDQRLKANRADFIKHAADLQKAALETKKAADAKNLDAMYEAGGKIDEACEACHKQFWYPEQTAPAAPAAKS